ncbi:MAG: lycopene cyclase domain-containing protein [Mycobacteriales bacterium]
MRFLYVGVLVACLLATLPLELFLRARVYARWRRWLLSLAPVVALFTAWDSYAIWRHHWAYSSTETTGWRIGNVPLEELAFFVVIPTCAILTYEAVGVVGTLSRRRARR